MPTLKQCWDKIYLQNKVVQRRDNTLSPMTVENKSETSKIISSKWTSYKQDFKYQSEQLEIKNSQKTYQRGNTIQLLKL